MIYEKSKTRQISFPLGGIGTGSIGLAGNGSLIDWEILNRPNKNSLNGYSHFALKVTDHGQSITKVLQGDTIEPLNGGGTGFGFGARTASMAGFPHFKEVRFDGSFPLATVQLSEEDFPVVATLHAFNPLIPHEEDNSSLPAAFFEWELKNRLDHALSCALAFSVQNPFEQSRNDTVEENDLSGAFLADAGHTAEQIGYGDLCLLTDHKTCAVQSNWYRGEFMDSCTMFWNQFSACDRMPPRHYDTVGKHDHASLVTYAELPAGETIRVRFVLAWNAPNQYNDWDPFRDQSGRDVIWKNYYATIFENSKATAAYAMRHFSSLFERTRLFTEALWGSSLPTAVLDAVSANLSVLKSPTVLRLTDGSLWAWEGVAATKGSCEGSCQHVWNYAYALPFLFPRLERSLRENTMKYALHPSGKTNFRIPLPLGRELNDFRACVDGQMGEVIKCYREWKISGDDAWLQRHASEIFSMLEYAWSEQNPDRWDADCDGVLEGRQHHTLDKELFGPNSWLEGFYLLALDCGAQIAEAIGDVTRAELYRERYEQGKAWTNRNLFNGSWFFQQVELKDKQRLEAFGATAEYWNDEVEEIKYQIGDGCIIDQMLADWHAAILGCNALFDTEKKKRALLSLYQNNYKSSMRSVANMWRNFAVDDESGTIICSYPSGAKKPSIPIPYCEECMTGFEYALAGLMLANGFRMEGEQMIRSVRDRYDGEKRNPWNEIECGSNYARSMAAFALLPIYSGFRFDYSAHWIGFAPLQNGTYLWSVGETWGIVRTDADVHRITVLGKPLQLCAYLIPQGKSAHTLCIDGVSCVFANGEDRITFSDAEIQRELEVGLQ